MNDQFDEAAPLVDEALAATDRKGDEKEELRALKAEVARLQQSFAATISGAGHMAFDEVGEKVRSQPVAVAVAVGCLAFLYGVTR
jgi:hypothetical protein